MDVICKIWDMEEVPQLLKNANIVTIFKERGDKKQNVETGEEYYCYSLLVKYYQEFC